jgi:hypothetical protein
MPDIISVKEGTGGAVPVEAIVFSRSVMKKITIAAMLQETNWGLKRFLPVR